MDRKNVCPTISFICYVEVEANVNSVCKGGFSLDVTPKGGIFDFNLIKMLAVGEMCKILN